MKPSLFNALKRIEEMEAQLPTIVADSKLNRNLLWFVLGNILIIYGFFILGAK